MFINDLPLCFEHCYSDLYADDTTIHDNDTDISDIENHSQCDF